MRREVKVLVLRTAGTNCDQETAFAFAQCGGRADLVHINRLLDRSVSLEEYHILAIPGGFTYGDDIMSGKILANELRLRLGREIAGFIAQEKLVIGICNGFQVLVRAGILPGPLEEGPAWTPDVPQTVTLTYNDSGQFEDRWVYLRSQGQSVWTQGIEGLVYLPVAHAEGKFISLNEDILEKIEKNSQVVFRYEDPSGRTVGYPANPNGSLANIAGLTDKTGRILGMMPHPERHFLFNQHPCWTRRAQTPSRGQGAKIFENGVRYVRDLLL